MDRQAAEQRRRQYLARMGLALPWLQPESDAARTGRAAPAAIRVPPRRLRDPVPETPMTAPAPQPAPVVVPAAPVAESVVRVAVFSLLALRTADGQLLVDATPGRLADWPAGRRSLALDLLTALSGRPVTVDWQQCLVWPPNATHSTVVEVRDLVLGLLAGQAERAALQRIVLLGDALPAWLGVDVAGQPLRMQPPEGFAGACLFLPGWSAGLDADAKRALWRAMAVLPRDG